MMRAYSQAGKIAALQAKCRNLMAQAQQAPEDAEMWSRPVNCQPQENKICPSQD